MYVKGVIEDQEIKFAATWKTPLDRDQSSLCSKDGR